jgi:hypothetical protein
MGEFRRADRARYRGEITGRGNIVHWILLSRVVANFWRERAAVLGTLISLKSGRV